MNKRADYMVLKVLLGIIVAILIILPLFYISKALLTTKEDSSKDFFNKLSYEITNLKNNEEKEVLFSISSKYSIIGFKKDADFIGTGIKQNCDDFSITQINKPEELKDKGGLCLCDSKLLSKEADACKDKEKSICVEFDYNIIDDKNSCGYFVLNGKADKNLKIKKQDNNITINKE